MTKQLSQIERVDTGIHRAAAAAAAGWTPAPVTQAQAAEAAPLLQFIAQRERFLTAAEK